MLEGQEYICDNCYENFIHTPGKSKTVHWDNHKSYVCSGKCMEDTISKTKYF